MSSKAAKTTATKAEEVKETAVAAEETKAAAEEKTTEKKETAKKETAKKDEAKPAKKAAPKRAAASATAAPKKAEKTELVPEVYVEYAGNQVLESEIIKRVKETYVEEGHRVASIKALQIYIKPEDGRAYYQINGGKSHGSVGLFD